MKNANLIVDFRGASESHSSIVVIWSGDILNNSNEAFVSGVQIRWSWRSRMPDQSVVGWLNNSGGPACNGSLNKIWDWLLPKRGGECFVEISIRAFTRAVWAFQPFYSFSPFSSSSSISRDSVWVGMDTSIDSSAWTECPWMFHKYPFWYFREYGTAWCE